MEDLDSTLNLIPINVIESILYDEDTFSKFVQTTGSFLDLERENIIVALNQYMKYVIRNSTEMDKVVFDRMNYINRRHNDNTYYEYETLQYHTVPIVTLDIIIKILTDKDTLDKFLDFHNHKEEFPLDLMSYLSSINEYINYCDKNGIELISEAKNNFSEIMKQYSLDYRIFSNIIGEEVTGELDPGFMNAILGDKYNDTQDMDVYETFAMARDIYIELCKRCDYDVTFSVLNQDLNNPVANNIYNKKAKDVTLENNNITCKSWAELYSLLLTKVGIRNKVVGDKHKYVVFDCKGTLMKADGTNNMQNTESNLFICDIAAIQLGLPTAGFTCLEPSKNIDRPLHLSDLKNQYNTTNQSNLLRKAINDYGDESMLNEDMEDHFEDKIQLLDRLSKGSVLKGLQLARYYKIIISNLFNLNERIKLQDCYIAVSVGENEYSAGVLLSRLVNEKDYEYYVLLKDVGIQKLNRDTVNMLINKGDLMVLGNKVIPGLEMEEKHGITQ